MPITVTRVGLYNTRRRKKYRQTWRCQSATQQANLCVASDELKVMLVLKSLMRPSSEMLLLVVLRVMVVRRPGTQGLNTTGSAASDGGQTTRDTRSQHYW